MRIKPTSLWLPGGLLFLVTPFLLFPTFSPLATALALTAVPLIWLTLRPPTITPFHIPLILFGLMIIVSILVSADPDLTLPKTTGLILGLVCWYFVLSAVRSYRLLRYSYLLFLLLSLGLTLIGALSTNWIFKVPLLEETIRALPTMRLLLPETADEGVQANQLAGTIIMYWPFLVALLMMWHPLHKKKRILLICLLALVTLLLILSQSRSGWIGALGSLIFLLSWFGWFHLPVQRRWFIGLAWLILILVCNLGYLLIGPQRLEQIWGDPTEKTVIGSFSSLGFRFEVWHWAVEGIKGFAFTGTGLGTFRRVAKRLFPINVPASYDISHAHNIFLQTALDIGLPGLVTYIALLLLACVIGWQLAQQNEALRPFAVGLVTGLIALHIYGLTDALALGSKTNILFWLNLGILGAMKNVADNNIAAPDT